MLNTSKTILRFFKSVICKYSPVKTNATTVEDIVNHVRCNDTISISGQPTKDQFTLIRDAGYAVVINLAPYDRIENPLKNEEAIVASLDMRYVHIPVNMLKPTSEDFDAFVREMKNASGAKTWVHCAIGMRASAFVFKYRCTILGQDPRTAIWDLRLIWEPFGVWKKFVFADRYAEPLG